MWRLKPLAKFVLRKNLLLLVIHLYLMDIRHRSPLPSLIVIMYGRRLVRDDLLVLGIEENAYYVPLIIYKHILAQIDVHLYICTEDSSMEFAHLEYLRGIMIKTSNPCKHVHHSNLSTWLWNVHKNRRVT